jgi:hypothetical protein
MAEDWSTVTITVIPDPLWTPEAEANAQNWLDLLRELEERDHG